MRINESKSRRFFLMEQICQREQSRQRFRKSSAERRRKIEQSLGDFMKTMSDVSYRQTGGSQVFRQGKFNSQLSPRRKLVQQTQHNEVINSPSFQDINILEEQKQREEIGSGRGETQDKVQDNDIRQVVEEGVIVDDEQIIYDKKRILDNNNNNVSQIGSSSSGIFFTSQFNDFINQNHLYPISQIETNHIKQQQVKAINLKVNTDEKVQSQQLAIQSNKQLQIIKQIAADDHDKQQQDFINNNRSSQSLAFSNQSSLKFSLNESNIRAIINQKFVHQLVLQSVTKQQQLSLLPHFKFQIFIDRFHSHLYKSTIKELQSFFKIYRLSRTIITRQKRFGFQGFLINQQLRLLEKKNQIKCEQFINAKRRQKTQIIFYNLKQLYFILPIQKLQLAARHYNQKLNQRTQKIFRCLKIVWFDQKVKKQIDLYYLSKLFAHFSRIVKNQKQQNRTKYLSFYCFNLKKRFFQLFKSGVEKGQIERIQRDNASSHYSFVLMRRVFDAWRDRLAYKDRYISLAMTTKNTFKETGDQRWMQIKTVDFRQIK